MCLKTLGPDPTLRVIIHDPFCHLPVLGQIPLGDEQKNLVTPGIEPGTVPASTQLQK
jgi:hypothetical protein